MARRFALLRRVLPSGWRARLQRQVDGLRKWAGLYGSGRPTRDPADATRFFIGPLRVHPEFAYIELDIEVRLTWDQTRDYIGSKLYFRTDPRHAYAEAACIFFWLRANGRSERLRLVLPAAALASGWLALRLDALPLTTGAAELRACRLVAAEARTRRSSAPLCCTR
ncbi:MAG: hypothetical protein IPM02_26095 [Betaproteobacteria bacterium]|nr:hypothetical protein [Betaproteobacteria bacterium]